MRSYMALLKVVCVNQAEAIHNCLVLVRLARSAVKYTGALRLNMPARGSLTGLRCVPQADTAKTAVPAPNAVQLRIRAVGLNFRDVLNVTCQLRGLRGSSGRNSRFGWGGDSLICFRHGTNVGSKIVSKINKEFFTTSQFLRVLLRSMCCVEDLWTCKIERESPNI